MTLKVINSVEVPRSVSLAAMVAIDSIDHDTIILAHGYVPYLADRPSS